MDAATSRVTPRQRRWFPRQWRDRMKPLNYVGNWERQKQEAYDDMDNDGFGYWTVFTAGAGLFTGAYDIFAVNTVVPIINIVYWGGQMSKRIELSIKLASLFGVLCGQVLFGILGDRYGRKKMFYRILIGLMVGTVFLSLVSKGAEDSLDVLALMIIWRFWMGCFIGGDYPLSAAITAEFAPKKHRGRMLAAVFFGQPLGQLCTCLISLIATSALKHGLLGASPTFCTGSCLHAADTAWRWIVGFGAIPPVVVLILRFYIPESPRWLLEVEKNPIGIDAAAYTKDKFFWDPLEEADIERDSTQNPPSDEQEMYFEDSAGFFNPLGIPSAGASSSRHPSNEKMGELDIQSSPKTRPMINASNDRLPALYMPEIGVTSPVPHDIQLHREDGIDHLSYENEESVLQDPERLRSEILRPELESWSDFRKSLREYLFGLEPWTLRRFWLCLRLKDEHFFDGSWTDLAGLSSTWFLLDFGFYFLIVNSFKLMGKIFAKIDPDDVYTEIYQYAWRIITSTSIGAVAGGALFIFMARLRWKLQLYGFIILVALLVAAGVVFIKLIDGPFYVVFIVLYCFCHLVFNAGPNFSTFVIAAEVFPTKFRASCLGISAAAGKLGSILTQIFLVEAEIGGKGVTDKGSHWLGWVLLIQAAVMLLGAFLTWCWVPDPCDVNGNPRSLEELSQGKQARMEMERRERNAESHGLSVERTV